MSLPRFRHRIGLGAIALTVALLQACGGGGGSPYATSPELTSQINGIKPTEADTSVPVFVEWGNSPVASAANLALDPDTQRRQLQQQFLADLQAAVAKPASGANATNTCDAASLSK